MSVTYITTKEAFFPNGFYVIYFLGTLPRKSTEHQGNASLSPKLPEIRYTITDKHLCTDYSVLFLPSDKALMCEVTHRNLLFLLGHDQSLFTVVVKLG